MGTVNVAVICNGESVLKHEFGSLIDTVDYVIRMGEFKMKGFEKFIGRKTDIIINRDKQIYDNTYIKTNVEMWSPHKIKDSEKILHIKHLNEEEIKNIKDDIKINTPTTGLMAYYLVDKFISNDKKIYYYGMDFQKGGEYWDKEHSHAKISLKENVNHEPIKERLWFNKMLNGYKILNLNNPI